MKMFGPLGFVRGLTEGPDIGPGRSQTGALCRPPDAGTSSRGRLLAGWVARDRSLKNPGFQGRYPGLEEINVGSVIGTPQRVVAANSSNSLPPRSCQRSKSRSRCTLPPTDASAMGFAWAASRRWHSCRPGRCVGDWWRPACPGDTRSDHYGLLGAHKPLRDKQCDRRGRPYPPRSHERLRSPRNADPERGRAGAVLSTGVSAMVSTLASHPGRVSQSIPNSSSSRWRRL